MKSVELKHLEVSAKFAVFLILLCTTSVCGIVSLVVSMWNEVGKWQRKECLFSGCSPY